MTNVYLRFLQQFGLQHHCPAIDVLCYTSSSSGDFGSFLIV